MAWEERTVKEMREEFVRRVLAKEKSGRLRCAGSTGSAVPQGTKWLQRFQEGQPLSDRSRAPQRQAGRVSPEMEASIVQLRQQYPALGAEKLRKIMENRGGENLPCARTFNNIFARHHLITKDASLAATHIQRFEKRSPTTCGRRISKEILLLPTAFAAIR
ncbi:MAG: helix-turn-helix domain-containing protein [Christensenellales bacterium]